MVIRSAQMHAYGDPGRGSRSLGICCVLVLMVTPMMGAAEKAEKEHPTFTQLLAARQSPDLSTLAERAAPDRSGPDASESFWDILKLREVGDAKAVPALQKILLAHQGSTRIHGFASAEALFRIGTPEALATLDKQLLSPAYRAQMGVMYAFHWEMRPGPRDEFIRRYHLKNQAKDVKLTVTADPMRGRELPLTVTLANLTDQPMSLSGGAIDQECLYFENAEGHIAWTREMGIRERWLTRWITLPPRGKETAKFTLEARTLKAGERRDAFLPAEQKLCLESGGVQFLIGQPGRFKVWVLLDVPPMTDQARKAMRPPDGALWAGRAVSEPATVEIVVPEPAQGGVPRDD